MTKNATGHLPIQQQVIFGAKNPPPDKCQERSSLIRLLITPASSEYRRRRHFKIDLRADLKGMLEELAKQNSRFYSD